MAPKPCPLMVTGVPADAFVGLIPLMLGTTEKLTPSLDVLLTVAITFPELALTGTWATMLLGLQFEMEAAVPLKVMVLAPCVEPKPRPVMVTKAPPAAKVGEILVMLGFTLKDTPPLARPPTTTTTFPVVAPLGTGTEMLVPLQLVGVAVVPLNEIVLAPCVAPKLDPLIVTDAPVTAGFGAIPLILGWTPNANAPASPDTVTTMLPLADPLGTGTTMVVVFQLVGVAVTPLNVIVLAPWLDPKFWPVTVMAVPTVPEPGLTLVMIGATAKLTPLLLWPAMVTTMLPVVAPTGTGTTI